MYIQNLVKEKTSAEIWCYMLTKQLQGLAYNYDPCLERSKAAKFQLLTVSEYKDLMVRNAKGPKRPLAQAGSAASDLLTSREFRGFFFKVGSVFSVKSVL